MTLIEWAVVGSCGGLMYGVTVDLLRVWRARRMRSKRDRKTYHVASDRL